MSVCSAAIRKMVDLGLSASDIADLCEIIERDQITPSPETTEERRKRMARERTDRWRASQNVTVTSQASQEENVTVTSQNVTERHDVTPLACVVDNNPSTEITGLVGVVVVEREEDWPTGDLAKHLTEAVASPWLDRNKSQGLVTTAGRIVAWRRAGASWVNDVVPVVTALCAKRRAPVATWQFFDGAVGASVAERRRDLEIPDLKTEERPNGRPIQSSKFAAKQANLARAFEAAQGLVDRERAERDRQ